MLRRVSTALRPRKQAQEHDAEKCERFSDDIMLYFLIEMRMILGQSA